MKKKRARRRYSPRLARIRTSLKRAHNVINLLVTGFDLLRADVVDMVLRTFVSEDSLDTEASELLALVP